MGGVWRTAKWDSVGYYSSIVYYFHKLLFINCCPPASTYDCSSMASPSCLHQPLFIHGLLFIQPPPLLHQLLFNQSSPSTTVQPALHGVVLFIQPSTGSCSSSPNQLDRSGSCSSRGNATGPVPYEALQGPSRPRSMAYYDTIAIFSSISFVCFIN